jgi:hypothetical protein
MKRPLAAALVSFGLELVATGGPALAQAQMLRYGRPQTNPLARPVLSPYIAYTNPNLDPAFTYEGYLKPLQDFNTGYTQLQGQVTTNQQAIANGPFDPNRPLTTGHRVGFFTHNVYFQTLGRGGARGFGTPGQGQAVGGPQIGNQGGRTMGAGLGILPLGVVGVTRGGFGGGAVRAGR